MSMSSKFYWKVAKQRMPVMVSVFILCTGLAMGLALKLPTTYSATARLLVEPPQISGMGTVVIDDPAQLQIIEQRLMVRSNLIDISDQYGVFENRAAMSPDEIVSTMRGKTKIESSSGRGEATTMSITFSAADAKTTSDVVNHFVTLILEDTLRIRTGRAEGKLAFFTREIERLNDDLDQQSDRILTFKADNTNSLPEDQPYRLSRLGDLQERLARIERDIAGQIQRRDGILVFSENAETFRPQSASPMSHDQRQLLTLQDELRNALVTFSEDNPRVKTLKGQIAALNTAIGAQPESSVARTAPSNDQQNSLLQINLADIDGAIDSLRAERVQANIAIGSLRDAIEKTPANQIALEALERDYNNLQNQYNTAVERRNQANMDLQLELDTKGQRVSVVEHASVPNQPASPNRPLIAAAGSAVGLGFALALFFLLEVLNRSARRPVELTKALGIVPLAIIPHMEDDRHRLLRRSRLIGGFLIVGVAMPASLWVIDTYYLPIDQILEQTLEPLGLS